MPEPVAFTLRNGGFQIEGYPDAVKVIRIEEPAARALSDLALHQGDLALSLEFLEVINRVPPGEEVMREGLWRAAIGGFFKCFGRSAARSRLDKVRIWGSDPGGLEAYAYLKNLRDKHLVHDENSWTQCETGAMLGGPDAQDKVVKVVSLAMQAGTLDQANYSNLHLLLTTARDWVRAEYDRIATDLSRKLEAKPYDELVNSPGLTSDRPGLLDPGVTR